MGNLFSGKTTTKSESTPWAPQGDALKNIFTQAGQNYSAQQGTGFYDGGLYAGANQNTLNAANTMGEYASTTGLQGAQDIGGYARSMLENGPNSAAAIQALFNQSNTDPTQANINSATQYANSGYADGMVDAASRDVSRNLRENTLTGINKAATGTGNMNSSRAGAAEAIATRGASDQIADISSQIRGGLYSTGLGLAENARGTNMGGMGQVAGLGQNNFNAGVNGLVNSNNLALGNLDAAVQAGSVDQQNRQGQLDEAYAKWAGNDTRSSELLNRYNSIISSGNWGGTQTNTQKSSPSIFGTVSGLGLSAAGLGLFGGAPKG